jgi:peptidoglycan hydrolase-like protein with peptidoglycan-binding domain
MRRRIVAGTATVVAVGLGASAALLLRGGHTGTASAQEPSTTTPPDTAIVERTDLVRTQEVDGTLTYGERTELSASGGGTVTSLPAVGSVIERGGVLWEVDGAAGPVLLYGARPVWRELSTAVSDGPDVQQLEENLADLGFADPAVLTVDQDFTAETARAVKRWQEALGVDETGRVGVDDVIFADGPVRVAGHVVGKGDPADGAVVEVTGTTRRVHVDMDASEAGLVAAGAPVDIELPDGTTVDGTVTAIGTTAEVQEADGGGTATTLDVEIDLAADVDALDESRVEVSLVSSRDEDVLAVPVEALLSLAEGGYAVERVGADGTTQLVAVDLGGFADGMVEVTGDLTDGDRVVVA